MSGPVFDPSVYEGEAPRLQARFYYHEKKLNAATANAGRVIKEPVPYIEIQVSERDRVCRKATDADKRMYPEQWAAFEGKGEQPIVGTPLSECSILTAKEVATFAQVGIRAVEQLLTAPDTIMQRIPEAYRIQKTVRAWATAAGKRANTSKLAAQVEDQQAEIDHLKSQLEEMSKRFCEVTGQDYEPAAGSKTSSKTKTRTKKEIEQ